MGNPAFYVSNVSDFTAKMVFFLIDISTSVSSLMEHLIQVTRALAFGHLRATNTLQTQNTPPPPQVFLLNKMSDLLEADETPSLVTAVKHGPLLREGGFRWRKHGVLLQEGKGCFRFHNSLNFKPDSTQTDGMTTKAGFYNCFTGQSSLFQRRT